MVGNYTIKGTTLTLNKFTRSLINADDRNSYSFFMI